MKSAIRLGASVGLVMLSMVLPRAAFADCAGGTSMQTMVRTGPVVRTDLAHPQPVSQQDDGPGFDHQASIVGLWRVTLIAGGMVIDVGFDAWHADGTETLNDASPISHNVCLGVWQQIGRRTFKLKHPAFRYDAAGNVIGTLVLRETNVVNRDGDRFTGEFTIQFFDLAGVVVFEGAGQITGERITVD